MCGCVRVCVHVHASVHVCVSVRVCMSMCMHVCVLCMCQNVRVSPCVCRHMYARVCVPVFLSVPLSVAAEAPVCPLTPRPPGRPGTVTLTLEGPRHSLQESGCSSGVATAPGLLGPVPSWGTEREAGAPVGCLQKPSARRAHRVR